MHPKQLEQHDLRFLRTELVKLLLVFLVNLIVFSGVAFALVAYLEDNNIPHARLAVISLFLSTYVAVLIVAVRPRMREISRGMKGAVTGTIADKRQRETYLPGSGALAMFTKPRQISYFLVVNDQEIGVEKIHFDRLVTGDQVTIHYSLRSGDIIHITKP